MAAPLINFDSNTFDGQVVDGVVSIVGFAQTFNSTGSVQIYANGQLIGTATYPTPRSDVPNSGFTFDFNSDRLAEGPVLLEARAFDASGALVGAAQRQLVVDRIEQIGNFEIPDVLGAGAATLAGWALAEDGFRSLEVLLDGHYLANASWRTAARPDVAAAFPEYGETRAGFTADVSLAGQAQGYHRLTLVGVQADGSRQEISEKDVFVQRGLHAEGVIETPSPMVATERGGSMTVSGWVVADSAPVRVEVFLDDRLAVSSTSFADRADVAAAVGGYGFQKGWSAAIPDFLLGTGTHDLRVVATLANGAKVGLDRGQDGLRDVSLLATGQQVGAHLNPQNDYSTVIRSFEAQTGTNLDIVMYYVSWNAQGFTGYPNLALQTRNEGAVPMITWESLNLSLEQIANGSQDNYIRGWANQISSYGSTVLLRLNHEFNGDYYPWSGAQNGNDPAAYVAAWRHVVDVFNAQGVTNARFVWSPNYKGTPSTPEPSRDMVNYYPGDAYVDFVGVSGYNWGNDPQNGTGWTDAAAIYTTFLQQVSALAPDKPVLVSEIGTSPDYDGNSAAQWIRDAFDVLDGFDQVKGVVWFNDLAYHRADGMDFRVAASPGEWGVVPGSRSVAFGESAADWVEQPGLHVFTQSLNGVRVDSAGSRVTLTGAGLDTTLEGQGLRLVFANGTLQDRDGDPLIDSIHYAATYRDIFVAGVDPASHFRSYGWHEGKDPNAYFSTLGYLSANADVRAAGVNPLDHYRANGAAEGRDPSAGFDLRLYKIYNPDVAAARLDPLQHYLTAGAAEGRRTHAAIGDDIRDGLDIQYYRLSQADVGLAGVDPVAHFHTAGWREGRDPNAYFDTSGYLATYADVRSAGIDPLAHYMANGWREGRDPSTAFDTSAYLAANSDVAAAGINPLQHFLTAGIFEGRSAQSDDTWG
ncbi:glycoside hydrolase family 26 protein [Roseomonas sp. 18066]|uniref:glycoside hydrolase family 26 protein n=1 Tax=Roseomonas sp. 18066 TaxID=2681412 RepID=UPI0013584E60|nr:glycosyl hydrolase [Roseomonas sp. 18066]